MDMAEVVAETLLVILFSVYSLYNIFTDLKEKRTSNKFHLGMLFLIVLCSILQNQFFQTIIIAGVILVFFLIFRQLPKMNFGAGDVKMLVIAFAFWNVYSGSIYVLLLLFMIYMISSFGYETIYRFRKREWKKSVLIAEAVPIFLASILTFIIIH